jgi:hypothetical protein
MRKWLRGDGKLSIFSVLFVYGISQRVSRAVGRRKSYCAYCCTEWSLLVYTTYMHYCCIIFVIHVDGLYVCYVLGVSSTMCCS